MLTNMDSFSIRARADWIFRNVSASGINAPTDNSSLNAAIKFLNGVGPNQVNQMYVAQRILTPATGIDLLDLNGVLTNQFGGVISLTALKFLLIWNLGEPDGLGNFTPIAGEDLLVGGAASNPFKHWTNNVGTSKLLLRSGGPLLLCDPLVGYTVAAGTADVLEIAYAGTTHAIEYDIVLAGVQ